MPYQWVKRPQRAPEQSGAFSVAPSTWAEQAEPLAELHLWPNRSLPQRGFVGVIAMTAALLLVPLLAMLGKPQLWVVLPFMLVTVGGLYMAFRRNYRDGNLLERLRLWPDRIELNRYEPKGRQLDWVAIPHWVRLTLHEDGGPVAHYLTLKGGNREVELGAFLSPDERVALMREIQNAIATCT